MATILQDQIPIQEVKQVKQCELDALQKRLDEQTKKSESEVTHVKKLLTMAEASRCEMQNNYQEMRIKYLQSNQEKEMLEAIINEKNQILRSEMVVWISSESILKYFNGAWEEKMGLKINHEGLITGFVYSND